jgi:ribosomal protein L29
MSKKKVKATSEMSDDKLIAEIAAKKKELMSLRFKLKLGELSDTSSFKKVRKAIAQLYTEIRKRKTGGE